MWLKTKNSTIAMICRYKACKQSLKFVRRAPDILSNWICPNCKRPMIAYATESGRKQNAQTREHTALVGQTIRPVRTRVRDRIKFDPEEF